MIFDNSIILSLIVVGFSLLTFVIMALLVIKGIEPEKVLRTFGTVLIVFSSIFLIVAGYTEQQIAPVIGLLGTVVGYIVGKSDSKLNKEG